MFETLFVYTTLMLLMIFFTHKAAIETDKRKRMCYYSLPVLLYTLVFGLRYCVGMDYMSYLYIYNSWHPDLTMQQNLDAISQEFTNIEKPFLIMIAVFRTIFHTHYAFFFGIIALIEISLLYAAFRHRKSILAASILPFFALGIATNLFQNILRQDIVFCIFLFAISFIIQQDWKRYFLCIGVACLFHKTALLLVPIYFIYCKSDFCILKTTASRIIILTIFFLLAYFDFTYVFVGTLNYIANITGYGIYMNTKYIVSNGSSVGLGLVLKYLMFCIMIFYYEKAKMHYKDRMFEILFDLFLIGMCGHLLFYRNLVFDRLFRYLTTFEFLIYGYYFVYFHQLRKDAKTYFFYIYIGLVTCSLYVLTIYDAPSTISTYTTIFETDKHKLLEQNRLDIINLINRNAENHKL